MASNGPRRVKRKQKNVLGLETAAQLSLAPSFAGDPAAASGMAPFGVFGVLRFRLTGRWTKSSFKSNSCRPAKHARHVEVPTEPAAGSHSLCDLNFAEHRSFCMTWSWFLETMLGRSSGGESWS